MLQNTFSHIPGIGVKTEQNIWASDIREWDDLNSAIEAELPAAVLRKIPMMRPFLEESRKHLSGNPRYFEKHLPSTLHWRLFPDFRAHTVYLDIETTGLDERDTITTIALYDGNGIHHFVNGQNLDEFPKVIQRYKVLVTYNGKTFDIPFIERYFGISLREHAHIDLRYVLTSLGYKGGLKRCEKALGIDRGEVDGIDGYFAVLLWKDYSESQNVKALETLLAYNIEDVVNLEILMVIAYNLKVEQTPFHREKQLPKPAPPALPFRPDRKTVERIRRRYYGF